MTFSLAEHAFGQDNNVSQNTIQNTALGTAVTSSQFVVGYVLWADISSQTISSVKDNATPQNTYNLRDKALSVTTGTWVQLFDLDAPGGTGLTQLTATLSANSSFISIFVSVYNRSNPVTFDQHATNTGNSAAPALLANLTPTNANSLVVSGVGNDGGGSITAGTNFTLTDADTLILGGNERWIQTTATGTTCGWTIGNSSTWSVVAASYFEQAAAAACPHTRTTLGVGCGIWAAKKLVENPRISRRDLIVPRRKMWYERPVSFIGVA